MAPSFFDGIPKQTIPCPICAGATFEPLCGTDRYLMKIRTVQCAGCGLIMTNPMPTPEALETFYTTHYRRFYRKLDTPDLSYIRRYAMDRRAQVTVDHLASESLIEPGGRVLDLGCGEGSILRAIVEQCPGVRAEGVEISPSFATFAEQYTGCPIHRRLEDIEGDADAPKYDLILLSHVLEHLIDPVDMLRRLSALLAPGGALFVDVPDVCKYHWLADLHLAHVYHFSLRTLAATARAAGLEVERWDYHQPPKLPGCVRIVARRGATPAQLPSIKNDEAIAAARIQHMGRLAVGFSLLFKLTMWSYEFWWNLRGTFNTHDVTPPVLPEYDGPMLEVVTTGHGSATASAVPR